MPTLQIETYLVDVFGLTPLQDRIGDQNAKRVAAFPDATVVRHLRDVDGDLVFVYCFNSQLGTEVWVLPANAVDGCPDTGGEVNAWNAFKAKMSTRAPQYTPAYHPARNRAPDNQEYPVAETALVQLWEMEANSDYSQTEG